MIAAFVLVDVRGAAKFAHPNHQCLVQQTSLLEIIQQCGQRLVGDRQLVLVDDLIHPCVIESVRIPAPLVDASPPNTGREIDRDELHARFNQATCKQAALAVSRASAAAIANRFALGRKVKGLAHPITCQHRDRTLVVLIKSLSGCGIIEKPRLLVDQLLQFTSPLQTINRQTLWQTQLGQLKARVIGIFKEQQGIVLFSEKARVLGRDD